VVELVEGGRAKGKENSLRVDVDQLVPQSLASEEFLNIHQKQDLVNRANPTLVLPVDIKVTIAAIKNKIEIPSP